MYAIRILYLGKLVEWEKLPNLANAGVESKLPLPIIFSCMIHIDMVPPVLDWMIDKESLGHHNILPN